MQAYRFDLQRAAQAPVSIWADYQQRFADEKDRAKVFHDFIIEEITSSNSDPCRVLDIGPGLGIEDDQDLQRSIAEHAGHMIGVEPDPAIPKPDFFDEWHQTLIEDTDIPEGSVDIAYAYMVLEHISDPNKFLSDVCRVLAPNGVFWGFTINRYNIFTLLSKFLEDIKLKDVYLTLIHGERGEDRYLNYKTFYRANSMRDLAKAATNFQTMEYIPLWKSGQLDFYLPSYFRWPFRCIDHALRPTKFGAATIAVRLQVGDPSEGSPRHLS